MFEVVADLTSPIISRVFGLPKEAVVAIAVGFLRKDVALGMLGTLDLTIKQLVVGATVLAMFFPCIATFVILFRELGLADTIKSIVIMLITSLIVGGLLNAIL